MVRLQAMNSDTVLGSDFGLTSSTSGLVLIRLGARPIFHHDLHTLEHLAEILGGDAPDRVAVAAGRVGDDQADRLLIRPSFLRRCNAEVRHSH